MLHVRTQRLSNEAPGPSVATFVASAKQGLGAGVRSVCKGSSQDGLRASSRQLVLKYQRTLVYMLGYDLRLELLAG